VGRGLPARVLHCNRTDRLGVSARSSATASAPMKCPRCGKSLDDDLVPRISLEAAEADAARFRELHENAQDYADTVRDELEDLKRYVAWSCGSDSGASSLTLLSAISAVDFCDGEFAIPSGQYRDFEFKTIRADSTHEAATTTALP